MTRKNKTKDTVLFLALALVAGGASAQAPEAGAPGPFTEEPWLLFQLATALKGKKVLAP